MKTFKVIRLIFPETVRVLKLKSYVFKDLEGHYCNHKKVPRKLLVPVSVGFWKPLVSKVFLGFRKLFCDRTFCFLWNFKPAIISRAFREAVVKIYCQISQKLRIKIFKN
jgi:hypothetical protein